MIRLFLSAWMLTIQTPDSTARAQMSDALVAMADSLTGLRGAAAQFVRDLESASPDLVLGRARTVLARCTAVSAAAAELDSVYARHATDIARDRGVTAFRGELRNLERELSRCEREWEVSSRPERVDSLRAWGPHRLSRLDDAVRRYQNAASGLPYRPKARGPR